MTIRAMFEPTAAVVAPEIPRRPGWHALAACRGHVDAFYIEGRGGRNGYAKARALCAACPVRAQCDAEADELPADLSAWGYRAGVAPSQRRARRAG